MEAEEEAKGQENVEIRNTGKRFQRKAARMENGGDGTFNGVEWLLRGRSARPRAIFWRCRPYRTRVVAAVVVVVVSGEWCRLLLLRATTQARGSPLVLRGAGSYSTCTLPVLCGGVALPLAEGERGGGATR